MTAMSAVESDVPVAGSCPGSVVALAALVGDTAADVGSTGPVVGGAAVVAGAIVVVGAMVVVGAVVGVCSAVTVRGRVAGGEFKPLALVQLAVIVKLPSTLKVTAKVKGEMLPPNAGGVAATGSGGVLRIVPSTTPTPLGQVTVTFTV
jgi:hypothetical protein